MMRGSLRSGLGLVVALGMVACGEAGETPGAVPGDAEEAAPISEANAHDRVPVIDAYYEGEKAWFIHTDVSAEPMADRLTRMVGYRTMHVPALAHVPDAVTGDIYVFRNGVDRSAARPWGGGPFHYQIDVLGSVPDDEGYSPLRVPHMVTWAETATPRILRSVREIREAEAAGELTVRRTDVVVNAPVVKWPGGEARLRDTGTGPAE